MQPDGMRNMEKDTILDIDGYLMDRSEAIYLLKKHWDKLPTEIQNELLILGVLKN